MQHIATLRSHFVCNRSRSAIRRWLVTLSSQFRHFRQPWRSRLRSPVAISEAVCANSAPARGSKHPPDCDPVSQRTASTSCAHFHGAQTRRDCRFGSSPADSLRRAHKERNPLDRVGGYQCLPAPVPDPQLAALIAGLPSCPTAAPFSQSRASGHYEWRWIMGRGILLWLLGIPLPIIILLLLFWH
jgi:hypothetical protein